MEKVCSPRVLVSMSSCSGDLRSVGHCKLCHENPGAWDELFAAELQAIEPEHRNVLVQQMPKICPSNPIYFSMKGMSFFSELLN